MLRRAHRSLRPCLAAWQRVGPCLIDDVATSGSVGGQPSWLSGPSQHPGPTTGPSSHWASSPVSGATVPCFFSTSSLAQLQRDSSQRDGDAARLAAKEGPMPSGSQSTSTAAEEEPEVVIPLTNTWVDRMPRAARPYLQLIRIDKPIGVWLRTLAGNTCSVWKKTSIPDRTFTLL